MVKGKRSGSRVIVFIRKSASRVFFRNLLRCCQGRSSAPIRSYRIGGLGNISQCADGIVNGLGGRVYPGTHGGNVRIGTIYYDCSASIFRFTRHPVIS